MLHCMQFTHINNTLTPTLPHTTSHHTESLGPTGAKMHNRQWADVDSDEETEISKKARSLRNPVNLTGSTGPETVTGESSILEAIRMRASHADNTVSDGRYGRDQDDNSSSRGGGSFRHEDSGPNFPRGQQFQNRDDQYSVS
jgi:hypothetical protein